MPVEIQDLLGTVGRDAWGYLTRRRCHLSPFSSSGPISRVSKPGGLGSTHTFPPVSEDTVSLGIQVNWHAFVAVIFTQQRQRGAC